MAPTLLAVRADDDKLVPESYAKQGSSLTPGATAGVVLGAVAGAIIILLLLYQCFGFGRRAGVEAVVVEPAHHHHHGHHKHRRSRRHSSGSHRSHRSGHHHHHHRRHSSHSHRRPSVVRARETVEVRTHDRRPYSGGGYAPSRPAPVFVRRPGDSVVDSTTGSDSDEVVVIEENGPRRR